MNVYSIKNCVMLFLVLLCTNIHTRQHDPDFTFKAPRAPITSALPTCTSCCGVCTGISNCLCALRCGIKNIESDIEELQMVLCSKIEASTESIIDILNVLTGSSLDNIKSSIECISSGLEELCSDTECVITRFSLIDALSESILDNISDFESVLSAIVTTTQSVSDVLGSKIDECCSLLDSDILSVNDVLTTKVDVIQSDVEAVLSKIDGLSTNGDICCSFLDNTILSVSDVLSQEIASSTDVIVTLLNDITGSTLEQFISDLACVSSNLEFICSESECLINAFSQIESLVEEIIDNLSVIDQGCFSAIDNATHILCSKIERIDIRLNSPIILNFTGSPIVITQPGYYVFNGDFSFANPGSCAITIASNDVTLNLNDFVLDGNMTSFAGICINNQSNIIIENGTIINTGGVSVSIIGSDTITLQNLIIRSSTNPNSSSIFIDTSVNITLDNLDIRNETGGSAVLVENSSNTIVNKTRGCSNSVAPFPFGIFSFMNAICTKITDSIACSTFGSTPTSVGFAFFNSDGAFISNAYVCSCFIGYQIENCINFTFDHCWCQDTENDGFHFDGTLSENIICEFCNAISGTRGFFINITDSIFIDCTAVANTTTGFTLGSGAKNTVLEDCTITNNTIGITIDSAATATRIVNSTIENNTSINIQNNSATTVNVNVNNTQLMLSSSVVTTITKGNLPFTIDAPGTYILEEDVTYTNASSFAITINSDDVIFDFGGHTIDGNSLGRGGVEINNFSNVTVRHGNITNTVDNGIHVNNAKNTTISNVMVHTITGTNNHAILLQSTNDTTINNSTVVNNSGGAGIRVESSTNTTINNTRGCSNMTAPFPFGIFSFIASLFTRISNTDACADNGGPSTSLGFGFSGGCIGISIRNCSAFNIGSGFEFADTTGISILECLVQKLLDNGFEFNNSSHASVTDSEVQEVGGNSYEFNGGDDIAVSVCIARNVLGDAYAFVDVVGVVITNCLASLVTLDAFSFINCEACALAVCTANTITGTAFLIDNSSGIVMAECLAENVIADAFTVTNSNTCTLKYPCANSIGANGISIISSTDIPILDVSLTGVNNGISVKQSANIPIDLASVEKVIAAGVAIDGSSELLLKDIDLSGLADFSYGYKLSNSNDISIKRSTVSGTPDFGLQLQAISSCDVIDLEIVGKQQVGVAAVSSNAVLMENIEISQPQLLAFSFSEMLDVMIDGVNIGESGGGGFQLSACDKVVIQNGTLMSITDTPFIFDTVNNAQLKNMNITSAGGDGVSLVNSSNIVIDNLDIAQAGGNGITGISISDFLMQAGHLRNALGDAINIVRSAQLTLDSNTITNPGRNGIDISGSIDITMKSSNVSGAGADGVSISGVPGQPATGVTIQNSSSVNNTGDGFKLLSTVDALVQDSMTNANGGDGFDLEAADDTLLCCVTAHANTGAGIFIDSNSSATDIMECCITRNHPDIDDNGTDTNIFNPTTIIDILNCGFGTSFGQADLVGGTYIITSPGTYILCEDIQAFLPSVSMIIIEADNVIVNLNGHLVNGNGISGFGGLINITGVNDARVHNGAFVGTAGSDISISNAFNVVLDNLKLLGNTVSADRITVNQSETVTLQSLEIETGTGSGILVENNSLNTQIKKVLITGDAAVPALLVVDTSNRTVIENVRLGGVLTGATTGIQATNADSVTITNCSVDFIQTGYAIVSSSNFNLTNARVSDVIAGGAGFAIEGPTCQNGIINGCVVNGSNSVGYMVSNTVSNVAFTDCLAIDVSDGFDINTVANLSFEHCLVEGSSSFGFTVANGSQILFTDCRANKCLQFGYFLSDVIATDLVNCCAQSVGEGIGLLNSSVINISNCQIIQATTNGIQLISSPQCVLEDIIVNSTGTTAYNINTGSNAVAIENCRALNCSIGFSADSSNGLIFKNCMVEGTTIGAGFTLTNSLQAVYDQSIALNCAGHGFDALTCTDVLYTKCTASNTTAGFYVDTTDQVLYCGCAAQANDIGQFIANTSTHTIVRDCCIGNNITNIQNNAADSDIICIDDLVCAIGQVIAITQDSFQGGLVDLLITQSGHYKLCENINFGNTIAIEVDDVILDLGGYYINDAVVSIHGSNVTVQNGTMKNSPSFIDIGSSIQNIVIQDLALETVVATGVNHFGIRVSSGPVSGLTIRNVKIFNGALENIIIAGSVGDLVTDLVLENIELIGTNPAFSGPATTIADLRLISCRGVRIKNITILNPATDLNGIILNTCTDTVIDGISISSAGSVSATAIGYLVQNSDVGEHKNILVDGGSSQAFTVGIQYSNGLTSIADNIFFDSSVLNCGTNGFSLETACLVKNCYAQANNIGFSSQGSDVIFVECFALSNLSDGFFIDGANNAFTACTSKFNQGNGYNTGFDTSGHVFESCVANYDGLDGFFMRSSGCSLIECTANGNSNGFIVEGNGCSFERCTANSNTSEGFYVFVTDGCNISESVANENSQYGFQIDNTTAKALFVLCDPTAVGSENSWAITNANEVRLTKNIAMNNVVGQFVMTGMVHDTGIIPCAPASFTMNIFPPIGLINLLDGSVFRNPFIATDTIKTANSSVAGYLQDSAGGNTSGAGQNGLTPPFTIVN